MHFCPIEYGFDTNKNELIKNLVTLFVFRVPEFEASLGGRIFFLTSIRSSAAVEIPPLNLCDA